MKKQTGKRKEGVSKTTIGMYLRSLRRVFNVADSLKIIKRDKCYPFGRDKYVIPSTRNIKKHLELDEIQQIYYYSCDPEMPWLRKARAFWFYMYFGNGMNPKDMLLLRFKDVKGQFLEFERAKTEETMKEDPPKISVFLNEDMLQTTTEYGNKDKKPENYIFPYFEPGMAPLRQLEVKNLFISFVNKWMTYILDQLGIKKKATTYVARHTYATVRRRGGASVDDIRDELGQVDSTTTRRYIGSLESEQTRSNSKQLEAFKKRNDTGEAA